MTIRNRFRSLLFVLLLSWTTAVSAQQAQRVLSYGIVSPNTKTGLKLEDAIKGMNSREATQLRHQAVNLSCVVRSRIRAFNAFGAWSDGAEHSVFFRVKGDEATLRYVTSLMGRDAQQKYVIFFHPDPAGTADLYRLQLRLRGRSLSTVSNELERGGIPFRTLVPSGETVAIYIIDLDRDLREKVLAVARKLSARVSHEAGSATLFGDDLREQAKVKFEEEIKSYETKHPNLPPACDVQKKGH
jgi:hypothetical protein